MSLASAIYHEAAQAGSGLAQLLWQDSVHQAELQSQLHHQHPWGPNPDLKLADQGSTGRTEVSLHCSARIATYVVGALFAPAEICDCSD